MINSPSNILNEFYNLASDTIKKGNAKIILKDLSPVHLRWIEIVVERSEHHKAVLAVLITSLTKKIETPNQDIRLHRSEMKEGYSGRGYDTKYITPFLKEKFRRFSMAESGWLTRSLEDPQPFTKDFQGKIRDKEVKEAFLNIINNVEIDKVSPKQYLLAIFLLLLEKSISGQILISKAIKYDNKISIQIIIDKLKKHFFYKYKGHGASRLPVVALFSIYELLINDVNRYKNMKLLPLKSHLSSDKKAKMIGDIQILDENNKFFEAIEVKHGKQIDFLMVEDAFEKFKECPPNRYYILTTAEPNIKPEDEKKVLGKIDSIRENLNSEIIVNGLIPSLKYYLRLINDPHKFILLYSKNLEIDFSKTSEIKEEHIFIWKKLIA